MMYCGPLFARKHDVFLCVAACLILSRWLLSFSLTATKTNIVYKRLPKESGFALQSQNISARGSNDSFSRTLQKKQNRTLNEVTEITQRNSLPKDAEDEEQEKYTNPPIVIISSVRPDYTIHLLRSLPVKVTSRRLMLVDRHPNDGSELSLLKTLATNHSFEVHVFHRSAATDRTSQSAKAAWYKMVGHAFSMLGPTDALFLEDDIVLAPDAIKSSHFLFKIKKENPNVHAIALGGWSGEHLINSKPFTFVIRRSKHFQAMAYGFNMSFFLSVERRWKAGVAKELRIRDWTEEISYLLPDAIASPRERKKKGVLYMAVPTMGRMHHIGKNGLGLTGRGSIRKTNKFPPWYPYSGFLKMKPYRLLPGTRDIFGFTCTPVREVCPCSPKHFPVRARMAYVDKHVHEHCDDTLIFGCREVDGHYDKRCCGRGFSSCDNCTCGRQECCF